MFHRPESQHVRMYEELSIQYSFIQYSTASYNTASYSTASVEITFTSGGSVGELRMYEGLIVQAK